MALYSVISVNFVIRSQECAFCTGNWAHRCTHSIAAYLVSRTGVELPPRSHRRQSHIPQSPPVIFVWLKLRRQSYSIFITRLGDVFLQYFDAVGWRQEGHPACKNWVVRYWRGYLSGTRCKLFAYGPADAHCRCHPIMSCSSKIQNGLPFWCRLTLAVLEKGR